MTPALITPVLNGAPLVRDKPGLQPAASSRGTGRPLVLLYPGQGAVRPGFLPSLLAAHPSLTPSAARLQGAWERETGASVAHLFTDPAADPGAGDFDAVQFALFASATLSGLLATGAADDLAGPVRRWHVGHSFGEIAALTVAGVWSLEAATAIVAARCRALAALHPGAAAPGVMTALAGPSARLAGLLAACEPGSVTVAGRNGADQWVASGDRTAVAALEAAATALGLQATRLRSAYPFHSRLLEAAVVPFADAVRRHPALTAAAVDVWSPVLGRAYRADDDLAALVASHLVEPFDFGAALVAVTGEDSRLVVECGAKATLSSVLRRVSAETAEHSWSPSASDAGHIPPLLIEPVDRRSGIPGEAALAAVRELAPARPASQEAPVTSALALDPALLAALREMVSESVESAVARALIQARGSAPAPVPVAAPSPSVPVVPAAAPVPAPPASMVSAVPAVAPVGREEALARLVEMYAQALEYPAEVLAADVDLEADLGVDSVKQTELLGRAASLFGMSMPAGEFSVGEYPTLGHVADLVTRATAGAVPAGTPAPAVPQVPESSAVPAVSAVSAVAPVGREEALARLVEMYAQALEYPAEVLAADVDLEADLGVDSVKQTELLGRAASLFGMSMPAGEFSVGEYPTLGHVADLVTRATAA